MNIMKAYERADKISSRSDLVAFMEAISKSIASKEFPTLKSYEVMDNFGQQHHRRSVIIDQQNNYALRVELFKSHCALFLRLSNSMRG